MLENKVQVSLLGNRKYPNYEVFIAINIALLRSLAFIWKDKLLGYYKFNKVIRRYLYGKVKRKDSNWRKS